MAKPNFQEILLQKGDKIALGAGGALAGLLVIFGLLSFAGAESPTGTITKFKSATENISRGMRSEGESAPELPLWVNKSSFSDQLPMDGFAMVGKPFEPIHQPDTRRTNPLVLPIVASQVDVIRGPMRSLDIYVEGQGNERTTRIGVLKQKSKIGDKNLASKAMQEAALKRLNTGSRARSNTGQVNRPRGAAGQPGGFPGGGQPGFGGLPGGAGLPPGGGGLAGGAPGFGGLPGGGQPGFGGLPGGGSGDEGGSGFEGEGAPGMMGMGLGMGGSGFGYANATRSDLAVEYATPEEIQNKGLQLAETVYPIRGVLVHAAFPLKEQLEEIRRALRARNLTEAVALSTVPLDGVMMTGPVFRGFEVERRRVGPDGSVSEWSVFDHENEYFREIASRAWANAPDSGDIGYFMKPGDQSYRQRLMAPLPALADNLAQYPRLRMKVIVDAITKLKDAGKPAPTMTDWQKRFSGSMGDANPYAPIGVGGSAGGASGIMGMGIGGLNDGGSMAPGAGLGSAGPGAMIPGGLPGAGLGSAGGPGAMIPGGRGPAGIPGGRGPGSGASMPGGDGIAGMPGMGTMTQSQFTLESEYLLLRFLDTTVKEGDTLQYRIRVKMQNPNFGKEQLTSRNEEAKQEVLYGPWAMVPETVSVPRESYFYAYKSSDYLDKVSKLAEDNGREISIRYFTEEKAVQEGRQAVVQVQDWMQQVRIEGTDKREPVGTWVIAEIPVAPGYPIARRTLVELPLWSAALNNYVLRDVSGGVKIAGIRNPKNQPKGWPVPFNTGCLLVDFEGGSIRERVNGREIFDDGDTELLVIRPDGKVQVRNSAADMLDKQRVSNAERWKSWLDQVRQRKDLTTQPSGEGLPGGTGGFGRGGPGS